MSQDFLAVLNVRDMPQNKFHFSRRNISSPSFDSISKDHAHSRSIL